MTKANLIKTIKERENEYRELALERLESEGVESVNYISMLSAWGAIKDLLEEIEEV